MLSTYLIQISLVALIFGGICYTIGVFMKNLQIEIIALIFLGVALISGIGAVVEKEVALKTSSSSYYYDMLEQKTFIEEQMKEHKKEIEVLHSGEVDGISFKSKNEMVNLDNTIKRYNDTILRQREYKDNYWHNERYNENVAKLNLFEEIFKEVY